MLMCHAEVDSLAEILHRNGVGPGAFVAVFMTNSPEMVFTILALAKLGAVPALINIALRSKFYLEIQYFRQLILLQTKLYSTA